MLSPEDVRFLGLLVHKGHLAKDLAERVFKSASTGTLERALVDEAGMAAERVAFLRRCGGEDVPAVPGMEIEALAGVGGTAVVVKATDKKSGRPVALKILHRDMNSDMVQKHRFVREAKMLMDLAHPSIVKGYRIGHVKPEGEGERLVFILEWIEGKTLLEMLRAGVHFEEDAALFIILQAAKALQYLHGRGILHRDVKPDNILLSQNNEVKLIDLGFATTMDAEKDGAADTTLGTAAYMSPEQAQGIGDLDVRSDIYSLGATLFQIMVGDLPFKGEGTQEQLAARILEALSSPELQSRRISPHMNYFIRKMMEQDRDLRYADMGELIENIEEQIRGKKTMNFGVGDDLDKPFGQPPAGPAEDRGGSSGGAGKFPTRRRRR